MVLVPDRAQSAAFEIKTPAEAGVSAVTIGGPRHVRASNEPASGRDARHGGTRAATGGAHPNACAKA